MDQRIILSHLNASRASQVENFPIDQFPKLTIGRDPSCEVRYDPEKEDLVSRRHAVISVDRKDPLEISVSDLGSRNGTFVNKQRIFSPVKLRSGDTVQFGAGGPEFRVELQPEPGGVKPTRLVEQVVAGATREAPGGVAVATPPPPPAPAGLGKATVERMIAQRESGTRKTMIIGGVLVLVLAVGIAAVLIATRKQPPAPPAPSSRTTLTPTDVAQANTDSVVFFEVGWKLIDMESGRGLNHVYFENKTKGKNGEMAELVPGAGPMLPVFAALGNEIEPILTTDDGGGRYRPIGGAHSGSGFVVSSDGFVLTNRHVAATWHTSYDLVQDSRAGLLLQFDPSFQQIQKAVPIGAQNFPGRWVPANAKFIIQGTLSQGAKKISGNPVSGKKVEGRDDYMDVTFPKNRIRIPAKLARVSDRIDVAMAKIDLPRSLRKVEMNDNYDTIKPGDAAIAMGYPGVSPAVVGFTRSKDVFNNQTEAKIIPDPTVSVGNIGRVIHGQLGGDEGVISTFGDVYQLTINSTGAGNSGGPVFDDQGRVIAIFTSGRRMDVSVSFAVPIRYGMELMGIAKVMK